MATIDALRKRRDRLKAQLAQLDIEISALDGVPRQQELSGLPSAPAQTRKPSAAQLDHRYFLVKRQARLEQLGGFVQDEPVNPAYVNVALKRIRDACRSDDELYDLVLEYLNEDWPARLKPPFPFTAFTSPKVWPKLLIQLRAQLEAH